MKKTIYAIIAVAAALGCGPVLTSCEQTDAERDKDATPHIDYVRVTDPAAADSLLVEATLGSQIVLMGSNLGNVQEIWFNDQKAKLNPTLITSFSIIVDVPDEIPTEVTNEIRLRTGKGKECVYPFGVRVPNPLIRAISCEYAKPGDEITIEGDYFIEPEVRFAGASSAAQLTKVSQKSISLIVPEGTVEGPVTIKSIYGTTRTKFNFMDTNGMICNFDDGYVNPWGRGVIVSGAADAISGNYLIFETAACNAWNWDETLMWGYWAYDATSKGVRPIAQGNVNELAVKFEVNIETWSDVPMILWFQKNTPGGNISPDDDYPQAHWKPWIKNGARTDAKTDGWQTVTIPLSDFKYDKEEKKDNMAIDDIANYTDFNVQIFGACETPGPIKVKCDNFRIVRIK